MPIHPPGEPLPGASYKGFSGGPAGAPPAGPAPRRGPRRPGLPTLAVGGVAAAVLLGAGFGFWVRPELGPAGPEAAGRPAPIAAPTDAAQAPSADTGAQVPIAVAPPPRPAPAAHAAGKLAALPPAALAARAASPAAPDAGAAADEGTETAAAPTTAAAPGAPSTPAVDAVPPPRAAFDCAGARPGAEQMVCQDPQLAAADRRLARAYRRALSSGVDPDELRQEQRDWTAIREDAARHSRQDVVQIYDQRIAELNRMAAGSDSGGDDGDYGGE